jgi:Transposase, Mutator family
MHTMALDQSALLELLDALKAGDADDVVRQWVEAVFQALIEAEATARIGAEPYQRTETRTTQRNGYRDRLVTTAAGDVELRSPKLRTGSFFPSLLERRRRIDQALFAVGMEAYVTGTSTRKVDELVVAMGADTGIGNSDVSRICADLDVEVSAFRDHSLAEVEFPYVFLDACFCKAGSATHPLPDRPARRICRTNEGPGPARLSHGARVVYEKLSAWPSAIRPGRWPAGCPAPGTCCRSRSLATARSTCPWWPRSPARSLCLAAMTVSTYR